MTADEMFNVFFNLLIQKVILSSMYIKMFHFHVAASFILDDHWTDDEGTQRRTLFRTFCEVIFSLSLPDFPVLDLSVCCRCCEGKR